MAKKVFTIQVDDKKLNDSVKSKKIKTTKTIAEKEVESFGIVEINNASAKSKVKNTKDAGYEKNVTDCQKKTVKSQLSHVDDYFDFSFRPVAEEKKEAKTKKVTTKKAVTSKVKAETKATKKVATKKAKTVETTVFKAESLEQNLERQSNIVAEACERISFDDEAERIICVARLGALFDCDKRMLNC